MDIYPEYDMSEDRDFLEGLVKEQLDPEQSAEELTVDILRNREMFEKMPSKINSLMENQKQKIVVENTQSPDSIVPGILIASSIFLALSIPTKYGIAAGAAGLALAYYLHRR